MSPEGGWWIAVLRALTDASLLSMLGALTFRAWAGPAGLGIARWSAGVACVVLPAWVVAQGVNLGGSTASALDVLTITEFGHLAAASWVCALVVLLAAGRGWRLGLALMAATGALVLHAGNSHAAAMEPGLSMLRLSTTIHLIAAAVWLGGLLPLARIVIASPLPAIVPAVRRYSALGVACVLLLAVTATFQGTVLVGGMAGWVGTSYGHIACAKVALFALLAGIALLNRSVFTPALTGLRPERARRSLAWSILAETACGLLIVGAAAVLSSLEPAMHQQPLWPFAWQPSLVTVSEDPDLLHEVLFAGASIIVAALAVVATLVVLRWRVATAVAALAVIWFAAPHLDLLFIPSYPTSFFRSPTAFAATSIERGASLYQPHCGACHGAAGRGDGPLAASLSVPPADLTASHLWMHSDGELFWWLAHGIEGPEGGLVMPGFAATLSDDDRWALIDYVRAHNAGLVRRADGDWTPPLQAPELNASCPDGADRTLAGLHGRVVRLVFPGPQPPPPVPQADMVTIMVGPDAAGCAAADPAVPAAYAIVLGRSAADLPGTTVLVDPSGWLRSDDPTSADPALLAALVQQICSSPIAANSGAHRHDD